MEKEKYRISYQQSELGPIPNIRNPIKYQTKLSQMSINLASEIDRYTNPEIPIRNEIKCKYDELNNMAAMSNVNVTSNYDRTDYPTSGRHSRFPVLISCDGCNELTMTDVEYEHGCASKTWCFLLLPILCTGCCCLCLNSCKDVRHFCSKCRKDAGLCKSKCI